MHETQVDIQIPFHDVDLMSVAWHGHYVRYLEIARTALMEKIGYSFREMRDSGYMWPIVDLHLRYPAPAELGQAIVVKAWFVEWDIRLKIRYEIRCKESGKRLTRATTTQVAIEAESREMSLTCPAVLVERIEKPA